MTNKNTMTVEITKEEEYNIIRVRVETESGQNGNFRFTEETIKALKQIHDLNFAEEVRPIIYDQFDGLTTTEKETIIEELNHYINENYSF